MTNSIKGTRRFWWLGGVALLLFALVAAFVVLPVVTPTPGADGPDVRLPKMENVPSPNAPKLQLEVQQDQR